ncbi:974c9426-7b5b-4dd5-b544-610f3acf48df [Thermothielavioides terrestris]|uniref:974c9426-7b5b-4dd5-b544-610f3acf48df n=1 Tax=Thermothielavioides terrestris TaxID=2587410 RepID=A0A3S5CXT3_9PEZI|nr:974c9426-7b5b-4dd5-b544-610f3acf48df [Thermothielavioides terrestris]
MAPKKAKLPSAGGKSDGSSPSEEPQGNLPGPQGLKRSADDLTDDENPDEVNGEGLRPSTKKQKVAFADEVTASSSSRLNRESSTPGADSGYFSPQEDSDVDDAASDACGESANERPRGPIDTSLPPMSDVREMFEDMVSRLGPGALQSNPVKLNVATLCSGTDAPIFALNLIQDAMQALGFGAGFEFEHLFSCEIEPFKQGFIRRNLPHGTLIFRDVVELASAKGQATTAGGAKAAIPAKPLDILFAGCSCVDYSNMNQNKPSESAPTLDRHLKNDGNKGSTRKAPEEQGGEDVRVPVEIDDDFVKDLDQGLDELLRVSAGESARTFFAAIKLITALRPKLIILENVAGAPWSMYTHKIFPKIGYLAHHEKLDSKYFYLPQTRQRGYLVAIDATHFGEDLAHEITSAWPGQLYKCKRRPSAPVSAFLQPPDAPATIQAKAEMESRPPCNADWSLCQLRHADTRRNKGLRRDDNPFSKKAMRNGRVIFASFPSHSWRPFWQAQVPRIVDLMDIVVAILLARGADLAFKTGMVDASQNVDRLPYVVGSGRRGLKTLGIVGCITPNGLPIVTDLMRPITGTETLALQGLPIDELVISTETQAQLRDLAGNAIGITLDAGKLLAFATKMVRVCYCFAPAGKVLECTACGVTACSTCRGNPEHDFVARHATGPELSAGPGKTELRDYLPNALMLPIPPSTIQHGLTPVKEELYRKVVSDALAKDAVYYFEDIKITEVVTACYKSSCSIARLVLSPDSGCHWYIYIAPWHPERAQLSGAFDFDQPVARGRLSSGDSVPQWSIWTLGEVKLKLRLASNAAGALVASDLSLAGDHSDGSPPCASLLAWKKVVESKVCGAYLHHPDCGTAGCALRIKQGSAPATRVFMMWESAGLRNPALDHFVWTETVRRMEPHEYRETLLHARPALAWNLKSDPGLVDVFWPGYWSTAPTADDAPEPARPMPPVGDLVQVHWGSSETIRQAACHAQQGALVARMPVLATVDATFRDFPLSAYRLPNIKFCETSETNDGFHVIPASRSDAFLKAFAFLSTEVRLSRAPEDVHAYPHLHGDWVLVDHCRECSVTPPKITVYTKANRKTKANVEKKPTKAIIEDPDEAARFERHFQDLPRAMAVAARLRRLDGGFVTMDMRIMLQPKTLSSRALGYLLQAHGTPSRGLLALRKAAETSFRVILDYSASRPTAGFAPFSESVRPCGAKYSAGIDLAGKFHPPEEGPPRFCRTDNKGIEIRHELRASQKDAVNWMLQREQVPLDFVKSEIEEEVVAPLNVRIVGKAEWANRFPYSSRGGVVAHEIGYGKTVVTLALLDYMRKFDAAESVDERKEKVDSAWAEELPSPFQLCGSAGAAYSNLKADTFFFHLSATLVIVPKHITDQWAAEIVKFLGLKKPQVLLIKSVAAWYDKYRLEELQKAEIIIVSSGVIGNAFFERLQTVAGRGPDYPKGLSGRTLEAWYRQALRNHRILTACYLAGRAAGIPHAQLMSTIWGILLPGLIEKQQAEIDELVEKQVQEIDRQLYKKAAKGSGTSSKQGGGRQRAGVKDDEEETKPSLGAADWNITSLHNCSFARVVWDECSYDEGGLVPLFVANVVANAKWLLSGTPKLFALEQVCKIASVFGIHVARPEPRMLPGLPAVTKGPELDPMSKSEEFHVYSSRVRSAALACERHSCAQAFVASYFRANALEEELEIPFEEHVRPVTMSTFNSARYYLLNQEVLDADFDYAALPAHARGEVVMRGSDLACRDGRAAAKMLMGLLACGLGGDGGSADVLKCDLLRRYDVLSDQMKMLWDKMMWLRLWITELRRREFGDSKLPDQARESLARVDALCAGLSGALKGDGDFEEFGGKEMFRREAAVVAALQEADLAAPFDADLGMDLLRLEWQTHFSQNWQDRYRKDKALYTWLDFFQIDKPTFYRLKRYQLLLLVEDICWLRYKVDRRATPLNDRLPEVDFLRDALAVGANAVARSIPPNIDALAANDALVLNDLTDDQLRQFLRACVEMKPAPPTWQQAKGSFEVGIPRGKRVKEWLQERALERNLKLNATQTADQLKEALWRHEQGLAACEHYRDGRAPPDRYRDMESATAACSAKPGPQVNATNEELKRTMVHLTKTLEDLRTTRLEAKFVPEFSSVADADDRDCVVKEKSCDCCRQPLSSASSSFLVVACGHFLCATCKSASRFYCPAKDCQAFIRQRPVLRCSEVPRPSDDGPRGKAGCVAEMIKNEIPRDEFVVVFAQYGPLIDALAKAFKEAGLSCLNLATLSDDKISSNLENFKSGKAGQILLLDMDSETSAGSNLTIATHVIFANPYVHNDEEHQARTIRQARGRCIRTGQTKLVHVYHFIVPGTIEEETLRKSCRDSPAVRDFFQNCGSIPWWLDDEMVENKAGRSDAQPSEEA